MSAAFFSFRSARQQCDLRFEIWATPLTLSKDDDKNSDLTTKPLWNTEPLVFEKFFHPSVQPISLRFDCPEGFSNSSLRMDLADLAARVACEP